MLVTLAVGVNLQGDQLATEIVANIKSAKGGKGEVVRARKLLSRAIVLTFKSIEAKD